MKNKAIFILILLIVSCARDTSIDFGDGYRFHYDPVISNDDAIFGPYFNTYAVAGHVLDYDFDSTFIIALQKPREVILADAYLYPNLTLDETENIFRESQLRHYWIIDKKARVKYGPFSEEEFFIKRKELKVSEELVLERR